MELWNLLTTERVQDFIEEAASKKMDALQISTRLNKDGFSNEERAAIMDYMALVPKFRDKFFDDKVRKGKFLLCDRLALEQSSKTLAKRRFRKRPVLRHGRRQLISPPFAQNYRSGS